MGASPFQATVLRKQQLGTSLKSSNRVSVPSVVLHAQWHLLSPFSLLLCLWLPWCREQGELLQLGSGRSQAQAGTAAVMSRFSFLGCSLPVWQQAWGKRVCLLLPMLLLRLPRMSLAKSSSMCSQAGVGQECLWSLPPCPRVSWEQWGQQQ